MKNIKLLFTLVLMTITVLGTSCSDWLDDISPRHAIPQSALTDDDLEKLLNGVYATMENYTFTFWWYCNKMWKQNDIWNCRKMFQDKQQNVWTDVFSGWSFISR